MVAAAEIPRLAVTVAVLIEATSDGYSEVDGEPSNVDGKTVEKVGESSENGGGCVVETFVSDPEFVTEIVLAVVETDAAVLIERGV